MKTLRSIPFTLLALSLLGAIHGAAFAQEHVHEHEPLPTAAEDASHDRPANHAQHGQTSAPLDHSHDVQVHSEHAQYPPAPEEKSADDHAQHHTPAPTQPTSAHDHHAMGHTAPSNEPLTPIPPVTDADRAAAFPELHHAMEHGSELNSFVLLDRLEGWDADHGSGQAWEAQGWIGGDLNRVWLRSEGERVDGHTESANVEVLYGRSVSAWWDVVGGIRHDFKPGPSQTWAAFGVQGLAPYKFEVQATAYVGESGQTAANVEVEYELLLTNRLILQPLIEVDLYGKDDPERGIGSGLSTAEAGLRLRYEFTRQFAPYVGVVHERAFGDTADLRRDEGETDEDTRFVVGVRVWF